MFLDGDGNEVDWLYGYSAPPDQFHERILKVLRGEDTAQSLIAQNAADPKNVQVLTKLANKYYDRSEYEKAVEFRRAVVAIDPDGKMGTTEFKKKPVSCTEFAEYQLGVAAIYGRGIPTRDNEPMERFLEKYPGSILKKDAYSSLSTFYTSGRAPKEAAEKFFDKAFVEYPDDPWMRYNYASSAVYSKENLDRAIEAVEEINSFPTSYYVNTKAELYALKGDLSRAEAVYGNEYAESLVSSTASILADYGDFWIRQKSNLESAEKMLKRAIQYDPGNTTPRETLAAYYLESGKTEQALEIYGPEYLKIPGVGSYSLTSYARFWISNKLNMESASAAVELALKPESMTSNSIDKYAIEYAAALFDQLGKPERALEIYGPEYVKPRMHDPLALSRYARFWAMKKTNLESALAASETAVTLKETIGLNRGFHWISLAAVYQALDRLDDAKKATEKAIEMSGGMNTDYYKTQLKKIQEEIDKRKK